ncbi:MAG: hypothetical protein IJZ03_01840 [Clostridia bacterium]|nr:hypothetical protein [Clostridia bacterium]
MSKFKRVLKIILGILVISAFLVGIPIVINECYKANCGYSTAWDASAMLGYYCTILGAIITVVTLVATITFTKKQIQRESFLKNESEKWSKLKSIFLDILSNINPMGTLKEVMDNGFIDPTKAIHILQRYQMNCKTSTDLLNAYLNMNDYPKVKHLIDGIAEMAEEFVDISSGEIEQYSDFRILQNKDSAYQMVEIEKARPGSFSKENLATNQEIIEKLKNISSENINSQIAFYNSEFIRVYETKYRALLQSIGSTFETLEVATAQEADRLLNFDSKSKVKHSHKEKKGNQNKD